MVEAAAADADAVVVVVAVGGVLLNPSKKG